jgi:hypothetical protein
VYDPLPLAVSCILVALQVNWLLGTLEEMLALGAELLARTVKLAVFGQPFAPNAVTL